MASTLRQAIAPSYLLMCLVFGGSAQGVWTNMALQLIGLGIIACAAAAPGEPLMRPARQLMGLMIIALAVVALQLVPLPATLWPQLGPRAEIAHGYRVLGLSIPSLPLSLDPYGSVETLLTLIPAVALFCAIVRLEAYRPSWLVIALGAGTFAGILLGAMQVASADPTSSPWYFYRSTNYGHAVGFFANANHMAILLVVTLPFLAALLVSARRGDGQRYSAALALVAGAALLILVGIALNRSLAGLGLAVPALGASVLIVLRRNSPAALWAALGSVVLLIAAVVALALSPLGERSLGTSLSVRSRASIMITTIEATRDFLPWGSGLGTFRAVYRLYEDHDQVTTTYVNHAHNDYAELGLELGVPGLLLIALFFAWWGAAAARAWRSADAGPYARAASIASVAILAHSIVDFPLRTAAISAIFAMCLALLASRRAPPRVKRSDLRPTRHIELR